MLSHYPQSAFQGVSEGRGGQQQLATQTLRVHLLGIDKFQGGRSIGTQMSLPCLNVFFVRVAPLQNEIG